MVHALPPAVSILRVTGRAATSISLSLSPSATKKRSRYFRLGISRFSIFEIFGCGLSSVVVMVCSNFFCVFGNLEGAQQRRSQKTRERRNLRTRRGRSKPGHGRGEYNTDRERGYRGGRTPLWRTRRRGVVWCGVVLENPPSLRSYARATFFFFSSSSQRGRGGRRIGFCERGERRGGAGGRVERLPAVSGHGTPALEPRRTAPSNPKPPHPPRWACMHGRTHDTHPPWPLPFRSGRVDLCLPLHVLFVLTFFSVFETQPTNTSSFFSHK